MTKEELKLVKWYDEGFPPIDLNENVSDVTALIRAYKKLQKDSTELLERLEKEIQRRMDDEIWNDGYLALDGVKNYLSTIKPK